MRKGIYKKAKIFKFLNSTEAKKIRIKDIRKIEKEVADAKKYQNLYKSVISNPRRNAVYAFKVEKSKGNLCNWEDHIKEDGNTYTVSDRVFDKGNI